MATIRFEVSEDTNKKLMQIKGDTKKLAFGRKDFREGGKCRVQKAE